ncbi:hypothetical protein J7J55_01615, partial [Candidatus Bipolaricaulota bacterium]|nr:hypothetical protein [Candidatus Bipolaricaulota bacterium]
LERVSFTFYAIGQNSARPRSASLKKLPKSGRIPQNLGYPTGKEGKVTRNSIQVHIEHEN